MYPPGGVPAAPFSMETNAIETNEFQMDLENPDEGSWKVQASHGMADQGTGLPSSYETTIENEADDGALSVDPPTSLAMLQSQTMTNSVGESMTPPTMGGQLAAMESGMTVGLVVMEKPSHSGAVFTDHGFSNPPSCQNDQDHERLMAMSAVFGPENSPITNKDLQLDFRARNGENACWNAQKSMPVECEVEVDLRSGSGGTVAVPPPPSIEVQCDLQSRPAPPGVIDDFSMGMGSHAGTLEGGSCPHHVHQGSKSP